MTRNLFLSIVMIGLTSLSQAAVPNFGTSDARVLGEKLYSDFNNDGTLDMAVLLLEEKQAPAYADLWVILKGANGAPDKNFQAKEIVQLAATSTGTGFGSVTHPPLLSISNEGSIRLNQESEQDNSYGSNWELTTIRFVVQNDELKIAKYFVTIGTAETGNYSTNECKWNGISGEGTLHRNGSEVGNFKVDPISYFAQNGISGTKLKEDIVSNMCGGIEGDEYDID